MHTVRYVVRVAGSWFGPLTERDAEFLRHKPPNQPPEVRWLKELVPPEFFPEGTGWLVVMFEDKAMSDTVGPLGSESDADGEKHARSHDVTHGYVEPLRPRDHLPGLP